MKKVLFAMQAAMGVRGCGSRGCQLGSWRWVLYHNI